MPGGNETYEIKIKEKAKQALGSIPDDPSIRERLVSSRTQLFDWLVNMDSAVRNPAGLINEVMIGQAVDALKGSATAITEKLSEAEVKTVAFTVLNAIFSKYARSAQLLSKHKKKALLWDNTGFHVDRGLQTVFAKVGSHPAQPIGFDDDTHLIISDVGKVLFNREFAFSLVLPFASPFLTTATESVSDTDGTTELTDKDRANISEAIAWFEEECDRYSKTEGAAMEQQIQRMRDTISLARLRIPLLEQQLTRFASENPDLGPQLEKSDIKHLTMTCLEYLRFLIDNDDSRKEIESTVVHTGTVTETKVSLINSLIKELDALGSTPDADAAASAFTKVSVAMPFLSDDIKALAGTDIQQAITTVRNLLNAELKSLVP